MDRVLSTLAYPVAIPDNQFSIVGSSDATKTLKFEVDAQTAGADLTINTGAQTADRTATVPVLSGNDTFAVIGQAQTFTAAQTINQTLAVSSDSSRNFAIRAGNATAPDFGGVNAAALFLADNTGWGYPAAFVADSLGRGFIVASQGYVNSISGTAFVLNLTSSTVADLYLLKTGGSAATDTLNIRANQLVLPNTGGATGLSVANTTSASSSTVGAVVIGNGVAATSVGLGGGNINAGGTLTVAGVTGLGGASSSLAVVNLGTANPLSGSTQLGLFVNGLTATPAATVAFRGAQITIGTPAAVFTCAEVTSLVCGNISQGAGSTITRAYSLRVSPPTVGGTANIAIANDSSITETGNWFIYDGGTYDSRFGGAITIAKATGTTLTVSSTTDSTSTTTGSVTTLGGISWGVTKSAFGGGFKSTSATLGIGYATGAGGAVTQITSRTTGVTLNTICGGITLVSAAGSATYQSFTVTNSAVAATDTVRVCQKSGTDLYEIHVTNVAAGTFQVTYRTTGGTTSEQPVFNFSIIKAVAS